MPTCSMCKSIFIGHTLCKRCDICEADHQRARHRAYNASENGRISKRIYKNTVKGKIAESRYVASEARRQTNLRYRKSSNGRAIDAKYRSAYVKTNKGMLIRLNANIRHNAKRRTLVGLDEYEVFAKSIRESKPQCNLCGSSWSSTHEIDHILSVGLGGTHHRHNLQVLCHDCHKSKTVIDMRLITARRTHSDLLEP